MQERHKNSRMVTAWVLSMAIGPFPVFTNAQERSGHWSRPGKTDRQRTQERSGPKTKIAGSPTNRVVVIYRQQPQAAIVEQFENLAAPQRDLARAQVERSAGFADARSRSQEQLDALILATRKSAMEAIAATIGPMQQTKAAILESAGATHVRRHLLMNMITADVTPEALAMLESDPDVLEVLPATLLRKQVTNAEIDPTVGALGMASWWNEGFRGNGQQVVILDTGINASHPVFAGKQVEARAFLESIRRNRCFADDPDSGRDVDGHGTHVAGIATGANDSVLSVFQGTAPGVNRIFALKVGAVLSGQGTCGDSGFALDDILDGIDFALTNTTARVYNMSFGGETSADDDIMARIVDVLADTFGITVVVAAGNSGAAGVGDTGITYNGISVANMDTRGTLSKQDDRIAASSGRGPTAGGRFKPDLAAPGTNIISASNQGSAFVRLSGTSMASPKVAGVAAVLHQAGITEPMAVRAHLINTSDSAGWQPDRGWGFVNMQNAFGARTILTSNVEAGGFRLFKGRHNGNLSTTLAWNRHLTSGLNGASVHHDLDLSVFDAEGNQLAISETSIQNVEQVAVNTNGEVVVKVKAFDLTFEGGIRNEKFSVAISQNGFVEATGAILGTRCTPSSATVTRGASFTVTCVVANIGDVAAVNGQVEMRATVLQNPLSANVDSILEPGTGRAFTARLTAPAQAGVVDVAFQSSASTAGEPISSADRIQIVVR
jgi:hypothetical protein